MSFDGSVDAFLSQTLLTFGAHSITVGKVVVAGSILVGAWFLLAMTGRAFDRAEQRTGADQRLGITRRLLRYVIGLIALLAALSALGIDLATLFTAGAFFAVGVGFAMQDIAQNFVAGVILLVERSIKPGDVIDLEGRFIRIREMGIRSTIAWTRDQEEIIVPNALLAQTVVKNYTLTDSNFRVRAAVGVSYSSDVPAVKALLRDVGNSLPWRVDSMEPVVLITGFGDNSINFELSVWTVNPWEARPTLSLMYEAIWSAFHEAGVVIAFPQLDVHLDPPVVRALGGAP